MLTTLSVVTAVILPVDAGATAEAGSMVPESAQVNPGKA